MNTRYTDVMLSAAVTVAGSILIAALLAHAAVALVGRLAF